MLIRRKGDEIRPKIAIFHNFKAVMETTMISTIVESRMMSVPGLPKPCDMERQQSFYIVVENIRGQ